MERRITEREMQIGRELMAASDECFRQIYEGMGYQVSTFDGMHDRLQEAVFDVEATEATAGMEAVETPAAEAEKT